MKKHYDFRKAVQGKMHRPASKLRIPVYLDRDVERGLVSTKQGADGSLSEIVNSILRKELEVAAMLQN